VGPIILQSLVVQVVLIRGKRGCIRKIEVVLALRGELEEGIDDPNYKRSGTVDAHLSRVSCLYNKSVR
jgi:hypothetical protein